MPADSPSLLVLLERKREERERVKYYHNLRKRCQRLHGARLALGLSLLNHLVFLHSSLLSLSLS
jgi:hypothetical protein